MSVPLDKHGRRHNIVYEGRAAFNSALCEDPKRDQDCTPPRDVSDLLLAGSRLQKTSSLQHRVDSESLQADSLERVAQGLAWSGARCRAGWRV